MLCPRSSDPCSGGGDESELAPAPVRATRLEGSVDMCDDDTCSTRVTDKDEEPPRVQNRADAEISEI